MIQLGVRVRGIAIEMYGERGQRGTKPAVVRDRDDGWNSDSLWLFYGGLP